jgi:hypothetical protein
MKTKPSKLLLWVYGTGVIVGCFLAVSGALSNSRTLLKIGLADFGITIAIGLLPLVGFLCFSLWEKMRRK